MTYAYAVLMLMLCCLLPALPVYSQLMFGPDAEQAGQSLDDIVAVVDDDVITRRELVVEVNQISHQLQKRGTPPPPAATLDKQVLERLVLDKLKLRAAERNGIVVDDPSLNAALESVARQNNASLSQLRATIERDGFSFADFREDIRRELLFTRLRQRVVDSHIIVTDVEVDNALAGSSNPTTPSSGGGATAYRVAQILIAVPEAASPAQVEAARQKAGEVLQQLRQGADFGRLAVAVSDDRQALEGGELGWRTTDQLPTLFLDVVPRLQPGQISDLLRSPSGFHIVKLLETRGGTAPAQTAATKQPPVTVNQVRLRHILLKTGPTDLSDAEARQRLEQLSQRLQTGSDFAELARTNSQDVTSALKGGDLGWVNPDELGPEFANVLAHLPTGQLSPPFQTPRGWHLVQVLERRQQQGGIEARRSQVREALFRRRVEEEWESWLRRLRDEAYVEIRLTGGAPSPSAPPAR